MQIIEKIVLTIACAFITTLFILFSGVRLFGYTPYIVTSGSMLPKYKIKSIVYTNTKIEFDELNVGDDITFKLQGSSLATHRIASINKKEQTVRTYGINNKDSNGENILDGKITTKDEIIGRVDYTIPYLGYIYGFVGTIQGKIITIGAFVVLFILFKILNKLLEKPEGGTLDE